MTISHDPDLPFAVVGKVSRQTYARFKFRGDAVAYIARINARGGTSAEVIDTTPKPRIPDDAEFVYWVSDLGKDFYARWSGDQLVWQLDTGACHTTDGLLDMIGDAEIIVLDRRKEQS